MTDEARAVGLLIEFVAVLGEAALWVSMTDATVLVYGTSGRGNANAKNQVMWLARRGLLEQVARGSALYFRPVKGSEAMVKQHPDYAYTVEMLERINRRGDIKPRASV